MTAGMWDLDLVPVIKMYLKMIEGEKTVVMCCSASVSIISDIPFYQQTLIVSQ